MNEGVHGSKQGGWRYGGACSGVLGFKILQSNVRGRRLRTGEQDVERSNQIEE